MNQLSTVERPRRREYSVEFKASVLEQSTQKDADAAVSTILDTMNNALARGHRIEIRGFRSFTVVHREPRLN